MEPAGAQGATVFGMVFGKRRKTHDATVERSSSTQEASSSSSSSAAPSTRNGGDALQAEQSLALIGAALTIRDYVGGTDKDHLVIHYPDWFWEIDGSPSQWLAEGRETAVHVKIGKLLAVTRELAFEGQGMHGSLLATHR